MLEHIGRVVVVAEEVQLVDLCPGSYPRHQGLGSASKGLEYLELFNKKKEKAYGGIITPGQDDHLLLITIL